MPLTILDIKEKLRLLDEITLLEMLNIHSEDLIERFSDIIEDRADQLEEEIKDDENEQL